jgi:hypothetical protein
MVGEDPVLPTKTEEAVMAAHVRKAVPPPPTGLDIKPRSLSIRSLDYRRAAPDLVNRVRSEFAEMQGFSPTIEQAARLFALPLDDCGRVLRTLVQEGFLLCTPDGRYRRLA